MLGRSPNPKVYFWELLWQNFYRPDALPVTQLTASKHCIMVTVRVRAMVRVRAS